ncbi:inositol monophosphatase 2 [Clarias magur]|uniref:Inositol monophosphatase 2 n=1 Tax=Clarias magur TaxID=1594786 RepID=A0A8J4UD40_CLAMG|nr:inositol monophosphatase 2 [Clarias magur]
MSSDTEAESWAECMDVAVRTALRAGQMVRVSVMQEKRVSSKSTPADLVTEADQQVEELIISTLREKFPSHRFIGEESSAAGEKCVLTDNPTWIIDPIDGTCNFVHSWSLVSYTTVSMGRCTLAGEVTGHFAMECEYMFQRRKGVLLISCPAVLLLPAPGR